MSVITQEIHILKKLFGENVIDSVINTIETAIKNAPKQITDTTEVEPALKIFEDAFYNDNGYKRLFDFKQFGSVYIATLYDESATTNKFVYVAYSIYDIIEVFNAYVKNKYVPYVKLYESEDKLDYNVNMVDSPKNYFNIKPPIATSSIYEKRPPKIDFQNLPLAGLNEINKMIVSFKNENVIQQVELECSPKNIGVSNVYESIENVDIVNLHYGKITFVVRDKEFKVEYNLDDSDYKDTKLEEFYKNIDKDEITKALDGFTLVNWYYEDKDGEKKTVEDLDELPLADIDEVVKTIYADVRDYISLIVFNDHTSADALHIDRGTKTLTEVLDENPEFKTKVDENYTDKKIVSYYAVEATNTSKKITSDELLSTDVVVYAETEDYPEAQVDEIYNFTSYGADTDTALSTGKAKIISVDLTNDKTNIEVTENDKYTSFVGSTFVVNSTKFIESKHYELYTTDGADTGMYVIITKDTE